MKKIFSMITMAIATQFAIAQTPDPFIQGVIAETSLDSLTKYVNELSGEVATTVNGNSVTILNRVSSSNNDIAADYLIQKLESFGLTVTDQVYSGNGRNVFAEQTGTTNPDEKYIICAHYDAVADYCADDNASGCAAVLEAARLLSDHTFPYTIVYALWDEEEIGLIGSNYYAEQASSNGDDIKGVLNLEMFGWDSDDDGLYDIHTQNIANSNDLAQTLVEVNTTYNLDIVHEIYNPGTSSSDHSSFWDEGYGAIVFSQAFFGGDYNPYYHTSDDRISEFNMSYFHEMSKLAIASLAKLAMGENTVPAPLATFTPNDGAVDVPVESSITVSFNTAMRNLDDSEITNPADLIVLRKGTSEGEDVAFSATINSEKTQITVIPDESLAYNQAYYVEVNNQIENVEDVAFEGASITFTTENNIGVMQITAENVSVYPNPAKNKLNLTFAGEIKEKVQVEIVNVAGASVLEHEIDFSKNTTLDISSLKSGMYFIRIKSSNAMVSQKLFKL